MIVKENFKLQDYNSYRINSECSKAWFPENENDFSVIFEKKIDNKIIIGSGNNIILSKDYYKEEFVILNGCFNKIQSYNNIVESEAGATMKQIAELCLNNSLTGFEAFYDIPSSVGGAIYMNAGNSEKEVKELVLKVRYLELDNMIIKEMKNEEILFGYRSSIFQSSNKKIILKSWFNLEKGTASEIKKKMDDIKTERWLKQPREYPNCGSTFKRPKGYYVGPLLEKLGLKGYSIGGAKISDKHAGFIINTGGASGEDIISLINFVKTCVYKEYGIKLEVEQRII